MKTKSGPTLKCYIHVITHASDACLKLLPTAGVDQWEVFQGVVISIHMNIMLVRDMKNDTYSSRFDAIFNSYIIITLHDYDNNINDKNENSFHHLYTYNIF